MDGDAARILASDKAASDLLTELSRLPEAVVPDSVMQQLFESFEELCRRRRRPIPAALRRPIYKLLAIEVAVNADVLSVLPEKVAPATLYNGVLNDLVERFQEFADTPGIWREALNYPSNPFGFLEKARRAIEQLERDERFVVFRDTPAIFKLAAIYRPGNPAAFLIRARRTIAELEEDKRFEDFRDTPAIFRLAALSHPSDPAGFVTNVKKQIGELERDERFAEFRETPAIFREAAMNHPGDPGSFLLRELARKKDRNGSKSSP